MRYYREVTLRDGRPCVLREPGPADAAAILDLMRQTSGETDFMLRYPDEIRMSETAEAELLQSKAESPRAQMICAELGGIVAANGGFDPVAEVEKCRHRAELGISVRREFWGLGIGTLILRGLIDKARAAGYSQLELDVVAENLRALRLYESLGFKAYGRRERSFLQRDGAYRALILMSLEL